MASYHDSEGCRGVAEPIFPAAPCSMCGLTSPFAFEKRPMHIECWLDSTVKTRAVLSVSSPNSDDMVENMSPLSGISLPSDGNSGRTSTLANESRAVRFHPKTTGSAADRRHFAGPAGGTRRRWIMAT